MRIIGPEGRRDKKVAVVVPSFKEGANALRTVASVARQEGINLEDVVVLVIVNNARDAAREVMESNEETLQLGMQLCEGRIGSELSDSSLEIDKYDYSLVNSCREIISKDLNLVMVDVSSGENALAECNVGIARNIGAEIACEYLDDEGVIVMIDADTFLKEKALLAVIKRFNENKMIAAANGPRVFQPPEHGGSPEHRAFVNYSVQMQLRSLSTMFIQIKNLTYESSALLMDMEKARKEWMPGSNMAFRPSAFNAVGEFPRENGAEDLGFSVKLLNAGMEIVAIDEFMVTVLARFSLRTSEDHAHGAALQKINELGLDVSQHLVESVESYQLLYELYLWLEVFKRHAKSKEEFLQLASQLWLTQPDLDEIALAYDKASNLYASQNPFFLNALDKVVNNRIPKKTISEVSEDLSEQIKTAAPLLQKGFEAMQGVVEIYGQIRNVANSIIDDWMEQKQKGMNEDSSESNNFFNDIKIGFMLPVDDQFAKNVDYHIEHYQLHLLLESYQLLKNVQMFFYEIEKIIERKDEIAPSIRQIIDVLQPLILNGLNDLTPSYLRSRLTLSIDEPYEVLIKITDRLINDDLVQAFIKLQQSYSEDGAAIMELNKLASDWVNDLIPAMLQNLKNHFTEEELMPVNHFADKVQLGLNGIVEEIKKLPPTLGSIKRIAKILEIV